MPASPRTDPEPPIFPPASGRQDFYGSQLRPEQTLELINAVIAGGQFSSTLARRGTDMASLVFPVVDSVDEPEWTAELDPIKVLGLEGEPLIVAPSRLSGITLISLEAVRDGGLNVTQGVEDALRAKYSAVVDRDLLTGSGEDPVPAGLIPQAAAVAGPDLWAATVAAKAEISASGGNPTHLAVSPAALGAEEARTDADGRPLWADGLATFAGVTTVPTPGAVVPMLYDAAKVYLVVRSDYEAYVSLDYGPAFERFAAALRLVVRLAAACPAPAMAMRKLTVTGTGTEPASAQARTQAAPPRSSTGRA